MALSKSLQQPFRKNQLMIGAGWRAFFAPYNYALGSSVANIAVGPKILDLQASLPIDDSNLPSGWFDLGWIKDVVITPGSKIGKVRSGYRGAVRAQYRGQVAEQIEFKFREGTRMAYKLASGSEVFNLLVGTGAQTTGPLTGSGAQAVAMVSYDPVAVAGPTVVVATGSGTLFTAGDYIVVDKDFTGQSGVVGDAGIPLFTNQVSGAPDVDFIRKTSDYVARIASINGDNLILSAKLVGGGSGNPVGFTVPQAGSKVQKIKGYVTREGATFVSEWSAMLVMQHIDLSQSVAYYPHLSISQFRNINAWDLEEAGTTDEKGYELDCVMEALAFDDPLDGETVVRYLAHIPGNGKDIQI